MKTYYTITEVAAMIGEETHTLRYWESEFSQLRPRRTRSGIRRYRAKDIEMARKIQNLLHVELYTVAGAQRQLNPPKADVPKFDGPKDADARAIAACHIVLDNFSGTVTRDSTARLLGLSPGYFSNLFRAEIGQPFSDYVIGIRLSHAAKRLEDFPVSVAEVARQCGFRSLAHFSRTFKARIGVSPMAYRKGARA